MNHIEIVIGKLGTSSHLIVGKCKHGRIVAADALDFLALGDHDSLVDMAQFIVEGSEFGVTWSVIPNEATFRFTGCGECEQEPPERLEIES